MMRRSFAFTYPCPRKLREIVKMTLFEKENSSTIKAIWNDYHLKRPQNVSTLITAHQFEVFQRRSQASPFFIFPLTRKGGHFVLLCQTQGKSNLFTYLEDYKRNPESSTPYFVLTLFDELIPKKGVVPVRGDIIDFKIAKTEAEVLMKAFLAYYIEGELYEDWVHVFNNQPDRFKTDQFMKSYFERFGVNG